MRASRSTRVFLALGLSFLLLASACSGDDEPTETTAAPSETPTPTPTEPPVCPLTGEDPSGGVKLSRPAIALKIEDSPDARPQSGLDEADIVFEEIVEGGITRFMAIFHCGDATQAGPVRSARFNDPEIAAPYTRIIAYSGSNGIVERQFDKSKIASLTEMTGGDAFFRVPPGVLQTHNLFANTKKIRAHDFKRGTPAPKQVFEFGPVPSDAKKAKSVALHFTAAATIEYRWAKGGWSRFEGGAPFLVATGDQIKVPNVLIQEVEVNNSPTIVDVAGNPSPEIDLQSGGRAFLFRDGKVIKGKWKIEKGQPVYTTKSGEPMTFAVGSTWIELLPSKKGQVKGSMAIN